MSELGAGDRWRQAGTGAKEACGRGSSPRLCFSKLLLETSKHTQRPRGQYNVPHVAIPQPQLLITIFGHSYFIFSCPHSPREDLETEPRCYRSVHFRLLVGVLAGEAVPSLVSMGTGELLGVGGVAPKLRPGGGVSSQVTGRGGQGKEGVVWPEGGQGQEGRQSRDQGSPSP